MKRPQCNEWHTGKYCTSVHYFQDWWASFEKPFLLCCIFEVVGIAYFFLSGSNHVGMFSCHGSCQQRHGYCRNCLCINWWGKKVDLTVSKLNCCKTDLINWFLSLNLLCILLTDRQSSVHQFHQRSSIKRVKDGSDTVVQWKHTRSWNPTPSNRPYLSSYSSQH